MRSPFSNLTTSRIRGCRPTGQVAFNFTKEGIINVATIPLTGGVLKPLTYDRELAGWPCWSPDGNYWLWK